MIQCMANNLFCLNSHENVQFLVVFNLVDRLVPQSNLPVCL